MGEKSGDEWGGRTIGKNQMTTQSDTYHNIDLKAVDRASEAVREIGDAYFLLYIALRMYRLAEIAEIEDDEYVALNDDD